MRPLLPGGEPPEFDKRVRVRGNRWLSTHPDAKASDYPSYWNEFRKEIQGAFDDCCAYLGFPIPSGQIDHFVAKSENPALTYEWSNYRWGEPRVNLLKTAKRFLDPFTLRPGWVTIDPVTLEYKADSSLPPALKVVADETFAVLNDPELTRGRRRMLRPFLNQDGRWDIGRLRLFFPLLADSAETFQRAYEDMVDTEPSSGFPPEG